MQGLVAGYFEPSLDESGPLGDEVLELFGQGFDGADGLGFLDFTIQVDGNGNAISLTDDWVSTAVICFNPLETLDPICTQDRHDLYVTADFCTQIIWSIPEYNGQENLYRFAYLTATEVENGGGPGVEELTEEVFHYQWAEDDMSFPDDCQVILCTLLPVDLIEFSAKLHNEKQTKLQWTTASEQNSSAYVIERRSESETEFYEVGKVEAAGLSNSTLNYEYFDQLPLSGQTLYYRLKMLDLDGTFEHSEIISINKDLNSKSLKLFPNPSNGLINLEFKTDETEAVNIEVFDYTGKQKLVNNILENANDGLTNQTINLSHLANGFYIVKINIGNEVMIQSLQIQK
jgi:hypothetical protein